MRSLAALALASLLLLVGCGPAPEPASPPAATTAASNSTRVTIFGPGGVLPMCQDTGTAIVMGKRGHLVFTGGGDEEDPPAVAGRLLQEIRAPLDAMLRAADKAEVDHADHGRRGLTHDE